jgi:hypothetical protein
MMENLAERRLKREENNVDYTTHSTNGQYASPHPPAPPEDDDYEDEDDEDDYDDSQGDSYEDEQVRRQA